MPLPIAYRVPTELLSEIFQHLHRSDKEDSLDAPNAPNRHDSSRAVSQVCLRWRSLALNSPSLWSEIAVTERSVDLSLSVEDAIDQATGTSTLGEESVSQFFPWVATMLARSSPKPIHLYIHLHCETFDSSLPKSENEESRSLKTPHAAILSRLISFYAPRMQSLKMLSDLWMPVQSFGTGLVGVPMPLLEVWDIRRDDNQWGHQSLSDISEMAEMLNLRRPSTNTGGSYSEAMFPKLKEVTLTGGLYSWSRFAPCNLVALNLGFLPLASRPTYAELKAVLLASQETLQCLTLCAAAPFDRGKPMTLPNVHTLSVGFAFSDCAFLLAENLDVPSLKSLEISDMISHRHHTLENELFGPTHTFTHLFYRSAISHWPLAQVNNLTLASAKFPLEPSDYRETTTVCTRTEGGYNTLPLPSAFLFQFTSLQNLTLIRPDNATFDALLWPVFFLNEQKAKLYPILEFAAVPCPTLDRLEVQDLDLDELIVHLTRLSRRSDYCPSFARLREVDTIVLDALPEWGASLRASLSSKVAREVVNKRGHFICDPKLGHKQEFDLPPFAETSRVYNLLST